MPDLKPLTGPEIESHLKVMLSSGDKLTQLTGKMSSYFGTPRLPGVLLDIDRHAKRMMDAATRLSNDRDAKQAARHPTGATGAVGAEPVEQAAKGANGPTGETPIATEGVEQGDTEAAKFP